MDTTEGGAAPNGPKPHLGLRATSLLGKVSVLGDRGEGWGRKAYYPKQTVGQTYLTLDRVEPSRRPINIGGYAGSEDGEGGCSRAKQYR